MHARLEGRPWVGQAECSQGPAVQHVQRERRLDRRHHGRGPLLVAHAATVLTPAPPQASEDGGEEGSGLLHEAILP